MPPGGMGTDRPKMLAQGDSWAGSGRLRRCRNRRASRWARTPPMGGMPPQGGPMPGGPPMRKEMFR